MSMLCTLLMLQNAISVDMVSQGLRRNFSSEPQRGFGPPTVSTFGASPLCKIPSDRGSDGSELPRFRYFLRK